MEYIEEKEELKEVVVSENKAIAKEQQPMSQDEVDQSGKANEDNECVICFDKPKQYLCVPCGHLCFCQDCKNATKDCPICRQKVVQIIKLFK